MPKKINGQEITVETVEGESHRFCGERLDYSYDSEMVTVTDDRGTRNVFPTRNVARVQLNKEAVDGPSR